MTTIEDYPPFQVPDTIGAVRFVVMGANDPVPLDVALSSHLVPVRPDGKRTALRLIGGCSNMSDEERAQVVPFLTAGLKPLVGFSSSGATREVNDGILNPMVTDVPAALVLQNPDKVWTMSTAPRTGEMGLVDDSRLVLDIESGLAPNPGVHMVVLVQDNNGNVSGWDGDVPFYREYMNGLRKTAGFVTGGLIFNGGGLSREEAEWFIRTNQPLIIVDGAKRASEEMAAELRAGTLSVDGIAVDTHTRPIRIVQNGDVEGLQRALVDLDLVAA